MIVRPNTVTRVASANRDRCYIAFQNLNTSDGEYVYLMPTEEEAETFMDSGAVVGSLGMLEIQNCSNMKSKGAWFAYTEVATGVDLRVVDI